MLLFSIGLMTVAALSVWLVRQQSRRADALFVISIIALYALQPAGLDIALPVATLLLIVGVWWLVTPPQAHTQADWKRLLLLIAIAAIMPMLHILNHTSSSEALWSLPILGTVVLGTFATSTLIPQSDLAARRRLALGFVVLIVILLLILKTPILQSAATAALSQASNTAILPNWSWFGFSYIAFRLMHILLDYRSERLKSVRLRDLTLYVIFFPALSAGPIDRVEHFVRELNTPRSLDSARFFDGLTRIAVGIFKKFVLADTLAYIALSPLLVSQAANAPIAAYWVMTYAYALRIFFDFSGYSDIAIGIGKLAGIDLPENFTLPYFKRNITLFWNSWHITLATWFRNYFFTPFSRLLIRYRLNRYVIIFMAQLSTMVLIGLWHGVALNFVLWGLWHGLGLWFHRWFTELPAVRAWDARVAATPRLARIIEGLSIVATFHFVALGWVFFVLPDLSLIGKTFVGLVGLHG